MNRGYSSAFVGCPEIHLPRLIARLPKTGQVFSSVEHGVIGEAGGLHVFGHFQHLSTKTAVILDSHPFQQFPTSLSFPDS